MDQRRPRGVYGVGEDPDARFSLANERTALAWLRTSLALVAAGVGLALLESADPAWARVRWLAVVVCLIGAASTVAAVLRWARVERAIRLGRPLPSPSPLFLVAAAVLLVGLVVAAIVLTAPAALP